MPRSVIAGAIAIAALVLAACGPSVEHVQLSGDEVHSESTAGRAPEVNERYGAFLLNDAHLLGDCRASALDAETDRPDVVAQLLVPAGEWFQFADPTVTARAVDPPSDLTATVEADLRRVTLDPAATKQSEASRRSLGVFEPYLRPMDEAIDAGHDLYVRVILVRDGMEYVETVVAVGSDERIAFVGECMYERASQPFVDRLVQSVAAVEARRDGADVIPAAEAFLTVALEPESDAARRSLLTPEVLARTQLGWDEWADIPPDLRTINPEDAPRDIVDRITWTGLKIQLPTGWSALEDTTICTKTPLGWGDCALIGSSANGSIEGLALPLVADGPTELWLLDGSARHASAYRRVASVDLAAVRIHDTRLEESMVVLRPTSDAAAAPDVAAERVSGVSEDDQAPDLSVASVRVREDG